MRFEATVLDAIRFRAQATGARFMTIEILNLDLGAPADFEETLSGLHDKGLITLHRDSQALTLTERGTRAALTRKRARLL